MSSPGPPARVEEGGVMYPVHDSDSEISYETEVVDKGASGDPGFYPELPFELGEDFIEEIRKYLVEEEGMDDKDEAKLTVEVMRMAEDLCEMSIADEDPALDDEIAEDVIEGMTPYVEAQEKWEQSQENAKEPTGDGSDLAEPSSDVSSDEDVPWIDDLCGWDTPGTSRAFLQSDRQLAVCLVMRSSTFLCLQKECPCQIMSLEKPLPKYWHGIRSAKTRVKALEHPWVGKRVVGHCTLQSQLTSWA